MDPLASDTRRLAAPSGLRPASGATSRAAPTALATLRALRDGDDPRGAWLDALLAESGARAAVWLPVDGGEGRRVRAAGRRGDAGAAELPRHLPWPLLLSLAPGTARALGPRELERWPGARATGLRAAIAGCGAAGDRLWIESGDALALDAARFGEWIEALAACERLDRHARERDRAETLVRRGAAAAGVAHDLRNQLSLASLELERLRELGPDGDAAPLTNALREARALSQAFLTGDGGGATTRALRGLLETELRAAAELADRPGVGARLRCPRGLAVEVDEVLLRRVLRNLLLNALHATDDGGDVRLEGRAADAARVEIVVEDDGRGMDERQLERWMRAGASGRGSTGFGTTSVLDCVRELGAELDIESERGAGTRCVVSLPRADAADAEAVIVCDGDPVQRRRVRRGLESRGVRAVECATAAAARARLDQTGARGLLVARGDRCRDALALRAVARAAGVPTAELTALADEARTLGELCARVGDRRSAD